MRIEFYNWNCGHHQECPGSIELPGDNGEQLVQMAEAILKAIAAAIVQPQSARARLVDESCFRKRDFFMTDDYVSSSDWERHSPE